MSFLSELKKQRERLRETETVVTTADGRKYVEGDDTARLEPSAFGFIVDNKPDDIPVLIVDNLYIGSQDCAVDSVCQKYEIKHILSLGVDANVEAVNKKYVLMLDLPETDIKPLLSQCLSFIRAAVNKKENVLVHCNAGVSRTATVAIAYVMHYERMTFEDAYNLVKTKRPAIRPNDGFKEQLKKMKPGQI